MLGPGELAALGGALCWGMDSLVVRRKARRANVVVLNAIMVSVAVVVAAALLLGLRWLGRHESAFGPEPARGVALLFASVVLALAVGNTAYFLAVQWVGVARAMPLSLTQPLVATLLAVPLLGERLTLGLGLAVVLIPAGVYLVTRPTDEEEEGSPARRKRTRLGMATALGAALAWALAAVTLRPGLDQVDPLTAAALRAGLGMLVLWPLSWRSERWLGAGQTEPPRLTAALLAGLFFSASMLLFVVAVQQVGAARATAVNASAPLFAVPVAAIWLGEKVTRWTAVGTLLTVAGVALAVGF
jgi:drug/metabolite transporter (DMT)-like permease